MSRVRVYGCWVLLGVLAGCVVSEGETAEESGQFQSTAIVSSITAGDYVIRSAQNNKCIDIAASSTADGAKVQLWDCNGTNAQKFNLAPTSDGYWKIINVNSGKGLDIKDVSYAQNAEVHQWSYVGGANQQFKFVARGNNQFSIHARHTDMVIDLLWGSSTNGTGFVQYPYTGTANQLFTFDKVSGGSGQGCLVANDGQTSLRFINKCSFELDFAGNNITGGSLGIGQEACRTIGSITTYMPTKRYWGFRKGEDPGFERRSLAEFGFNEVFYSYTSWDWFNLSHVDAHNLPLKIVPYDVAGGTTCSGQIRSCPQNLLTNCPAVGQLRNAAGQIISCWSPERDNPNSVVARYFDAGCSQSYSWSGDDSVMAACNAEDFDIIFCPQT
ncbi:ricin-type beta-trefoil lectin protein [Archangium gephyra]|uniref:Endo-1,4-beta-xylanase A n=1 Tax=Archangium gephyra TaxID=48 RepID=A0AAC8TJ22_9BACT|nr:RICIN domain-containing protein [Archangium gephyra]AKJ06226.1 Endo-1,4-beta-xylanase A precursor [Archangium gephyra]REG27023.1 ricin-type beta-trefoil lectin protein [Archangium gephyra]